MGGEDDAINPLPPPGVDDPWPGSSGGMEETGYPDPSPPPVSRDLGALLDRAETPPPVQWQYRGNAAAVENIPLLNRVPGVAQLKVQYRGDDGHLWDIGFVAPDITQDGLILRYRKPGEYRLIPMDEQGIDLRPGSPGILRVPADHPTLLRAQHGDTGPSGIPVGSPMMAGIDPALVDQILAREDAWNSRREAAAAEAQRVREEATRAREENAKTSAQSIIEANRELLRSKLEIEKEQSKMLAEQQAGIERMRTEAMNTLIQGTKDTSATMMGMMTTFMTAQMAAMQTQMASEQGRLNASIEMERSRIAAEAERDRQARADRLAQEREDRERRDRLEREEREARREAAAAEAQRQREHAIAMAEAHKIVQSQSNPIEQMGLLVNGLVPILGRLGVRMPGDDQDDDDGEALPTAPTAGVALIQGITQVVSRGIETFGKVATKTLDQEADFEEDDDYEEGEVIQNRLPLPNTPPPAAQPQPMAPPVQQEPADPGARAAARASRAGLDVKVCKTARQVLSTNAERFTMQNQGDWLGICGELFAGHGDVLQAYLEAVGLKTGFLEAGCKPDVATLLVGKLDETGFIPKEVPRT